MFDLGGKSRALLPSHGLRSDRVTAMDGRQGGAPSCSDRGGGRGPNPPAVGRSFAALLSELVWQPVGAEAAAVVTVDREGTARTAGGLCVLPRDLARFGEMMRRDGAAQGREVVPAWWVSDIRAGGDAGPWLRGGMSYLLPAGRYRSQWYQVGNASGAFCAIGIHGQWLWIDPAREVVIAKVSAQPDPISDAIDLVLIRAFDALAAAL